jgi:archaellum biogenesis ATPase FlaH
MKFEEWLNENEGFSIRLERVVEDILIHEKTYEEKYKSLIEWLETSYKMGFEEASNFNKIKNKQVIKIDSFENLNETLSKEELNQMIAETIWMADRPRTWSEWFSWSFLRKM